MVALTIGLEDYTADLGVAKTAEGRESLYARSRLVNASRATGVQAIDSVFGDVGDMDGLRRWAENSRALGFEGMGCIHPRQIPVIHEAFAPSPAEIEKALKIVAAFDEAQQRGLGVVSLGSKMIDPPVVQRAAEAGGAGEADGDRAVRNPRHGVRMLGSKARSWLQNAAGRMVPAMVNGKPQIPYLGVAKYPPRGRKAAPPVRSSKDYPDNGDKRLPDLETALRKCGLRDGMVISNHHHLRDGDRVALMMLEAAAKMASKTCSGFPAHRFLHRKRRSN